ncbi:twin-arginine translocase TatA/TatE family subunit [Halovenus rubra]|uniref:Twin-arginine translocase TatA/TatE family subunit n=2 Tax=Halovenus rubra TaxID=869890 RepID=A0ABD5X6N2_9EURY|nr:twin-arginine translocase TatA/TatE family subunit [Halovenus rubra]
MQPGFIGGIPGGMEVGVVLILTVLLFGADRIPRLAQSVGESMGATGTGDD